MVVTEEMFKAVSWPDPSLAYAHEDGATEGWVAEIVCSLMKGIGAKRVVELGGFMGTTSAWLALTLEKLSGDNLTISEPDEERARAIEKRLGQLDLTIEYSVSRLPSPRIIETFEKKSIDFAFVDNDHTKPHVEQEIVYLWDRMKKGGIIALHDVFGVTDLRTVVAKYGGYSLDLPRLGPAGGLGIIQLPTWTVN